MNIFNLTYNQNNYSKINNENKYSLNMTNLKNSPNTKTINTQNAEDSISLSRKTNKIGSLGLDKGTAANTTLFVDRNSFDRIVSYSANNESCKWDELGIDGEKRWVVINGQRFECPLSPEEKEAFKRASMTIVDYMVEAEKEKIEESSKEKNSEKVSINSSNNVDITSSNPKINNLLNNEPVMNMLKEIASQNGGNITLYT